MFRLAEPASGSILIDKEPVILCNNFMTHIL